MLRLRFRLSAGPLLFTKSRETLGPTDPQIELTRVALVLSGVWVWLPVHLVYNKIMCGFYVQEQLCKTFSIFGPRNECNWSWRCRCQVYSLFTGCCSPFTPLPANVKHPNCLVVNDKHLVVFIISICVISMDVWQEGEPYRLCLEQRPCPWQGRTGYFLRRSLFPCYHHGPLVARAEEKCDGVFLSFLYGTFLWSISLGYNSSGKQVFFFGLPGSRSCVWSFRKGYVDVRDM